MKAHLSILKHNTHRPAEAWKAYLCFELLPSVTSCFQILLMFWGSATNEGVFVLIYRTPRFSQMWQRRQAGRRTITTTLPPRPDWMMLGEDVRLFNNISSPGHASFTSFFKGSHERADSRHVTLGEGKRNHHKHTSHPVWSSHAPEHITESNTLQQLGNKKYWFWLVLNCSAWFTFTKTNRTRYKLTCSCSSMSDHKRSLNHKHAFYFSAAFGHKRSLLYINSLFLHRLAVFKIQYIQYFFFFF